MSPKGFSGILFLVGVLLIIGIGFVSYLLIKFYPQIAPLKSTKDNDSVSVVITDTTNAPSKSSSLKLYQYNNFSIQLSDEWVLSGSTADGTLGKMKGLFEEVKFSNKENKFDLFIQVTDDPYPYTQYLTYFKAKEFTLDGVPGVKFINIAGQGAEIYSPNLTANFNNKRFDIYLYAFVDESLSDKELEKAIPILEKEADAEFQKVISSFKFVK